MKADNRFTNQPKEFWASVRTISQELGYTDRRTRSVLVPEATRIRTAFANIGLSSAHLFDRLERPTKRGALILDYFKFRADVLNRVVRLQLMDRAAAEREFNRLRKALEPSCPLPLNKQKGEKRNHAFLTGMVNMLVESTIRDLPCDYDPRSLTTITRNSQPLRTLSRRVDGAFPSVVNPVAIWEVKEYYYTTTFGSRVADGVYETLLDGMELRELESTAARKVHHVLVVDDHFTWWECGRSYLCRMIDMLHMGYVGNVLFGREVLTEMPRLARSWVKEFRARA